MWRLVFALSTLFNSLSIVFEVLALFFLRRIDADTENSKFAEKIALQDDLLITTIAFYTFAWLLMVPANFVYEQQRSKVGYFFAYLAYIFNTVLSIIIAMDYSMTRDLYSTNDLYTESVALFSVGFIFNIFNIYVGIYTLAPQPINLITVLP